MICPLLPGRPFFVLQHPLDLELGELLVAVIAQEQGLAAVADEYEAIVRDLDLAHEAATACYGHGQEA